MVLLTRPGAVVGGPLRRTAPGRDDLCATSLCRRLTIPSGRGHWCTHAPARGGSRGPPCGHGPPTERPAVPARAPSTVVRVTQEGTTEWPIRIRRPRLVIRPPGEGDSDSVIRLITDPVTREYLAGAVDYVSRQALELSPLGLTWGRWVLALADDDTMIGSITLGYDRGELELSYALLPEWTGRGYAAESCIALLAWARDE